MKRGLAWLGAGLVAFVVLILISAPELAAVDAGSLMGIVLLAAAAGLPGLALLLIIAAKRRGDQPDGREER